ncbi:MAG: polyprenyl synthetase family protein [Campylobacteraceae bacterium]
MDEFINELGCENVYNLYKNVPTGKMLRSKLILNIAKKEEDSVKLAAIVELIHAASLLHDDVIDEADTRRGKTSFNKKFGDKNAIMMGDILYSYGFSKLSSMQNAVAQCISYAVAQLAIGELNDIELSKNFNDDKDKYMQMIYQKTASLIEASAKSAAILAKLDEKDFALYGKNLGLAFQIIDDILDVTEDEATLGKPALSDFKEGKATLPYIYMYKKCDEKEKQKLLSLYKKELNANDGLWIKSTMQKYGVIEMCINEARVLGKEALKAIEKYNIEGLNKVIISMIDRNF